MLLITLILLALSTIVSVGSLLGLKNALQSDHPELHDQLFSTRMFWWRELQYVILGWRAATGWFMENECSDRVCDAANVARYPLYVSTLLLATVLLLVVAN